MPDPITLTVVGSLALTEGIKFLYAQAGEVMKRWRERRAANAVESKAAEPIDVGLPEVFEGQLARPEIHFNEVERLQHSLLELRSRLSNYADGAQAVTEPDENLLESVNGLREVLEAIFQQRITFKGERREPSGTRLTTRITLDEVEGKAIGTRIAELRGGDVTTDAKVRRVGPGGELIGTDIGKMKTPRSDD